MPINTLATAQKFTGELDKLFAQKTVTGFMLDNAFRAKFVGAKTILIPDLDMAGLADYDRDNGFAKGATTISHESYTLTKDRGRQLQIDREDMDETGVSNLAGQILGEFVRTKVVPECDAYVLSTLAGIANTRSHASTYAENSVYADLTDLILSVQNAAGFDEELVAFVDTTMYGKLMSANEITRHIIVSDFKQGDVNMKVKSLNGVALIPVNESRMKTVYEYTDNGFAEGSGAQAIRSIVLPKRACSLVKKTETMRIFTPEQNKDADAYVFNYRLYYDAFVKNSGLDSIWALLD